MYNYSTSCTENHLNENGSNAVTTTANNARTGIATGITAALITTNAARNAVDHLLLLQRLCNGHDNND